MCLKYDFQQFERRSAMQPMDIMPPQATMIGGTGLSYERRNGKFLYWHYSMPIDSHDEDDIGARNLAIARLAGFGADFHDLAKAFGITVRHVRNLMHAFRTRGWREFTKPIKRRGPSAISEEQKAEAERLLAEGASLRDAASESGIKLATLYWNMRKGRIGAAVAGGSSAEGMEAPDAAGEETASEETAAPVDRGTREMLDRAAPMGRGACNAKERVKASKGELPDGTQPRFDEPRLGVRGGAALVAVPGMLANGLLHRVREFLSVPAGYCSLELVLMAQTTFHLLGKPAAELLGRESPAELGKAFGFDRLPCIETFREKIKALAKDLSRVMGWRDALSKLWHSQIPDDLGRVFNLDKHFKVCSTRKGRIARNWLNNKKRCLPSEARLWANALGGEPLFCIARS